MIHFLYTVWDIGETPGIDLGFFVIRYYSLLWILAFVAGYYVMNWIFKQEKVDKVYLEPFLMYCIIGCMLGARLGHVLFYQRELITEDPLSIVLPFSFKDGIRFTGFAGLASHGATLGFIVSTFLFHRKYPKLDLIWLFDRLVMCVPIGGAMIRIGNFVNSEIVGKAYDGALSVKFPHQSADYGSVVPRHPAQLYEAVGYIILFIVLMIIYTTTDKRNYRGWIFGFFLVCLFTVRFIVEFFKEPQTGEYIADSLNIGLNNGQLLSIPFILLGFYLMYNAKKYKQVS